MLNLLITVEFEGINKEVIFITCESIYELILVLMCCAMSGVQAPADILKTMNYRPKFDNFIVSVCR